MNLKFRALRADEVEARVATVKKDKNSAGVSILLYKDARCDQNVLDETVGPLNWQRHHTRENANCIVSIWDDDKCQWIEKEDTGTESYTEKEKGLASDSFKRACFCWGIGRELYTAPFIWVPEGKCEIKPKGSGYTCNDRFSVKSMEVENGKITQVTIWNNTKKCEAYSWGRRKTTQQAPAPQQPERPVKEQASSLEELNDELIAKTMAQPINQAKWTALYNKAVSKGIKQATILKNIGVDSPSKITFGKWDETMKWLETLPDIQKGA